MTDTAKLESQVFALVHRLTSVSRDWVIYGKMSPNSLDALRVKLERLIEALEQLKIDGSIQEP